MDKLTDLELCKKIAEIEGLDVEVDNGKVYIIGELFGNSYRELYSPISSKALILDLIKKYNISMIKDGENWSSMIVENIVLDWSLNFKFLNRDPDYNRAALLCIAEAHKC